MTGRIPYGRQDISAEDIDAVVAVLKSDYLTQGPAVPRFETALTDYCGAGHAVAMSSATAALHVACLALGLGPGDLLWTSPITFLASANAGRYCGADVDFVDIDAKTYNLCPERLEEKLAAAEKAGRLPKIVVPVHLAGQSCDMEPIAALAKRYGFRIIEDASHAIGGRYRDTRVGSCRYADVTVFSFHPVKVITTGEGGAAMTNDSDLAERMRALRSHGMTRDAAAMTAPPPGPWYYEQRSLGFNYRITDIQAALGASQLSRLDDFVAKRHALAERYDERLKPLPVATPHRRQDTYSGFHLYVIRVKDRTKVFNAMAADGIGVNVHYIPVHTQPYYRAHGHARSRFAEAESYYDEAITIPLFPGLTHAEQDRVIDSVKRAVS